MSGFVPEVIAPTPDPWFVKALKVIDPNLRVRWGYGQYFVNKWALERKMSPERYHELYRSILESGENRIVDQPIFDTTQSEFDPETGEFVSYKQIGVRKFDLAPEYEWVMFSDYLNEHFLVDIRRAYSWERNQPFSRQRFEMKQEEERKQELQKKKNAEAIREGLDEAFSALRKKVVFGYGAKRNEREV